VAVTALNPPVRQTFNDFDLVVPAASRTARGITVTLFVQRDREPLQSLELLITVPAERSGIAPQLSMLGPVDAVERALVTLSFAVETAIQEREATRPTAREPQAQQGRALGLDDPEPWHEPVEGARLLEELQATFDRYLVLPKGAAQVLALWTLHTYLPESFDHTPYLAITSPTKRSGKTTTVHTVKAHVRRALAADDVSPAALFRVIEKEGPTLLIDEVDRVPRDSDIWCILNSGHARGGRVLRCEGTDNEVRFFQTFSPKLLAYIRGSRSSVPDTVEDRSIRISLQRRSQGERREKLRSRALEAEAAPVRRRLARWALDNESSLNARPEVPGELDDRAADCWEPLIAIADAIGGGWPQAARELAIRFSAGRQEDEAESAGVLLLMDLGALLDAGALVVDLGISAEHAIRALHELPDRPWRTWGQGGRGLTEAGFARLLRPFDVRSEMVGPSELRRKRYNECALRMAIARFSSGVRVGEGETTVTPSHLPANVAVSNSATSSVRVCGLDPHIQVAQSNTSSNQELIP
jgi:putative DNA primase/helicase